MDSTEQSQTVLSLCSGSLGLERGIELATGGNLNTVAYVEVEAWIVWNLVKQMEKMVLAPAPIFTDVKAFAGIAHLFRGKISGITAGYPCQPFSLSGRRAGVEDERHLFPYIAKIINSVRPVWCFFENVPGHLTLGYREVRLTLQSLGYTVTEGIYSAEEVGAPHKRARLFILAVCNTECSGRRSQSAGGLGFVPNPIQDKRRKESPDTIKTSGEFPNNNRKRESQQERCKQKIWEWGGIIPNTTEQRFSNSGQTGIRFCEETYSKEIRATTELDSNVPNSETEGLEGGNTKGTKSTGRQFGEFPAFFGEPQKEWESPRIESMLGFRVNGYDHRTDLLRLGGNAVVPQTAAKAWTELWNKLNNYNSK